MLILLGGRHRNLLNLSLGLAVAPVIPQTCIYKQNNSNFIYFGREMPRAAWHCCICSFLLTKGELFVLVWLHCKKNVYYIIKMQRQPLKKWIKSLEKQYLFIRMILLFSDQNALKQGRFFIFLLIYSSLFPTSPLICPLQGSGNNYNTFTFTKVICNVIYEIWDKLWKMQYWEFSTSSKYFSSENEPVNYFFTSLRCSWCCLRD